MAFRPLITAATATILVLSLSDRAVAQQNQLSDKTQGIITDRLTPKEQGIWKSILEVVLARDQENRPLYPHLYKLYSQAEMSSHPVYIAMKNQKNFSSAAGLCSPELQDRGTDRLSVTISLNLFMIDEAALHPLPEGCTAFAGLGKKERYAEVLGHELAHAIRIFEDPEYLRLYQELSNDGDELDIRIVHKLDLATRERLMDNVLNAKREIEKPAEAAEAMIWRELCGRK